MKTPAHPHPPITLPTHHVSSHPGPFLPHRVGIWVDHKNAILTFLDDAEGVERKDGVSVVRVAFTGGARTATADDHHERHQVEHRRRYFDGIISHLAGMSSIVLFGPGEAKTELQARMVEKGLRGVIVGLETAESMTPNQMSAWVRGYFRR